MSGSNIGSFTVVDGTDNGNSVGDVVEMLPTAAWAQDLADALTNQHSRVGAHVGITNTAGLTTDTLTVTSGTTFPAGDIATADLADSAIIPNKLLASTGTTWAWQDFTPSLINWTIGSGGSAATVAKYTQIGKTVIVRIKSTLGTSGQSVSGEPEFALPVTASSSFAALDALNIVRLQAAATGFTGYFRLTSTSACKLVPMTANATYVGDGTMSSTVPATWAAGDFFSGVFIYEAA